MITHVNRLLLIKRQILVELKHLLFAGHEDDNKVKDHLLLLSLSNVLYD